MRKPAIVIRQESDGEMLFYSYTEILKPGFYWSHLDYLSHRFTRTEAEKTAEKLRVAESDQSIRAITIRELEIIRVLES